MSAAIQEHVSSLAGPMLPGPGELSRFLGELYANAPLKVRLMATGRPFIAPLDRILPLLPARARMLDCGCGSGFLLAASIEYLGMTEVVGFDVDETAMDIARTALSRAGGSKSSVTLLHANTFATSPQATFDVVTVVDVLHHVPLDARRAFLRDAFSRVRPGGRVIYKDMADRPAIFALTNYLHDLILTGERVRLTPIEEVEQLAAEMGLRCESGDFARRWWYGHEWRVFLRPS